CGLSAVVNRVNLPETGCFALPAGAGGTDGDTAFEGGKGFGEALPLHPAVHHDLPGRAAARQPAAGWRICGDTR
ncbi:MAG: hypothetical protein LBK13_08205, partial [Spirochaetales bacterium]|nr:hypothetical protein [Spirochaetales bacterium]